MRKARTHFDVVPLEVVRKIAAQPAAAEKAKRPAKIGRTRAIRKRRRTRGTG